MARKAVKGYAEKNYYDNTRFSNGIVATNDPLNEGYFKHLVNFDISDMGQSITPRKGFLTTTFKMEYKIDLPKNAIYFFDANTGYWIFIDWQNAFKAYAVKFDIKDKYIIGVALINNYDYSGLTNSHYDPEDLGDLYHNLAYTTPVHTNIAEPAINEYGVTDYIIKVNYKYGDYDEIYWFAFNYKVEHDTDTLTVRLLDTENVVDTVDTNNRNLASFASIIPDPMQEILSDPPLGFIQQFPMIYFKQGDEYLINTANTIDGIEIIPNFYLKEPANNTFNWHEPSTGATFERQKYIWAYTYDITSTNQDNVLLDKESVHSGYVYSLEDNQFILGYNYFDTFNYIIDKINSYIPGVLYTNNIVDDTAYVPSAIMYNSFLEEYSETTYDKELQILEDLYPTHNPMEFTTNDQYEILIYVMPNIDGTTQGVTLPIELLPKEDMTIFHTAWYSNRYIRFTNAIKVPSDIITLYETNTGKKVTYTGDDNNLVTATDATDIYQYLLETYSICNTNKCTRASQFNLTFNIFKEFLIDEYNASSKSKYLTPSAVQSILYAYKDTLNAYKYYIRYISDIKYNYIENNEVLNNSAGYTKIQQTAFNSDIIAFDNDSSLIDIDDLIKYISNNTSKIKYITFKYMDTCARVIVPKISDTLIRNNIRIRELSKLFSHIHANTADYIVAANINNVFVPTSMQQYIMDYSTNITDYEDTTLSYLFNVYKKEDNTDTALNFSLSFLPCIYHTHALYTVEENGIEMGEEHCYVHALRMFDPITESNLFNKDDNTNLKAELTTYNNLYQLLKNEKYFDTGLVINIYLMLVPTRYYINQEIPNALKYYNRDYFINSTSLKLARQIYLDTKEPTTYVQKLTQEPQAIKNAKEYFIFKGLLGDHLVVWNENTLFISKEGKPYYFTYDYMFEYPETIVKAIQYKDMVLVFTMQNLYAVYLLEQKESVQSGTDSEGNPQYTQVSVYKFATLPVLYNLRVDPLYKDAIQVYNQMVLFYSADGQMFLIKPTAAVDSNTRFSIQYFNKSANDILLNYKQYMQERLRIYGIDKEITDVKIKVSADINYIKIFYIAEGIMTYILIYDVLNNRYTVQDTISFSGINSIQYCPLGDIYITEDGQHLHFTLPFTDINEYDNNVDINYTNHFNKFPIKAELDTGVINLNNHLKKRFKDLHIIYKNLNANDLEYSIEMFIDDVPIITCIETTLEVRTIGAQQSIVTVDTFKVKNLLDQNTALFDFSEYSSNKVITHKTNIVSRGKQVRLKLYFSSKGKYKVQGFGLVYKEHTL